jgi:L-ascorbate metabolism protein UlaG (beta-lactamase superfamily)
MEQINNFLKSNNDGVYYVGHASIIVRIEKKNFLFDYVKESMPYGDTWRFFPPLVDHLPYDLIDGIFISHIHQDHFDPILLKDGSIKCPIYIIGGRKRFEDSLNSQEISYVRINPGYKVEIAPKIYVQGFLHHSNGVDASCIIGNKNFSVYHGNDNYLDNDLLKDIDDEFYKIDVACIPYAYINWYPQLLENLTLSEKSSESERLCNHYFEYAINQADVLNANQVIPFGANLIYKDSAKSPLNLECKTPLDFEAYVKKTRGVEIASRFKALFAGDSIVKMNGELRLNVVGNYKPEEFREEMQRYLDMLNAESKAAIEKLPVYAYDIPPRIAISTPTAYDHFIIVKPKEFNCGTVINTKNSLVSKITVDELEDSKIEYTIINISEEFLYTQWLVGGVTIEEIIGSRKFSMYRKPNIYNKEILLIATTQI